MTGFCCALQPIVRWLLGFHELHHSQIMRQMLSLDFCCRQWRHVLPGSPEGAADVTCSAQDLQGYKLSCLRGMSDSPV